MSKASIARAASRVANKSKHQTRGMMGNRGKDGSLLSASTDKASEPWSSKIEEVKDRLAELDAKLEAEMDNVVAVRGYPQVHEEKMIVIFDKYYKKQLDVINKLEKEMNDSSLDIPKDLVDKKAEALNELHNTDDYRARVKRDMEELERREAGEEPERKRVGWRDTIDGDEATKYSSLDI